MKENVKFWTFLASAILAVAVAVMLIDMSIKASILEESNSLRLLIEGGRNDQARKTRAMDATSGNGSRSPDVLGANDAGLETGNVPASDTVSPLSRGPRKSRSNPRGQSSGDIPPAN
jgi:hypothetical protein